MINTSYTVDDFLQAHFAFRQLRHPKLISRMKTGLVLLAALAVCYSAVTLVSVIGSILNSYFLDFTFSDHVINLMVSMALITLFFAGYYNILWRLIFWLDIRNAKNSGVQISSLEFDDSILQYKGDKVSTNIEWKFYLEVLETESAFLLIKESKYHLVLKRWLPSVEDINRFREIARNHLMYYEDSGRKKTLNKVFCNFLCSLRA